MPSSGPPTASQIAEASRNTFAALGGDYDVGDDGALEYRGERPGPNWHIHGWLKRWLWFISDGGLERRRLRKRRWRCVSTGRTCHSRPPDDWGPSHFCWLFVLLKLWPWLNGDAGLHNKRELSNAFDNHGCSRTVQRWLRKLSAKAIDIEQAIRFALIERCEPRPVEQLFPRGLSPPKALMRRHWRKPELVTSLHRALTMLFAGTIEFGIPTAVLLAEARGR